MQKPLESLDDFLKEIEPEVTTPPSPVSIYPTGEIETLTPLARWERPEQPAAVAEEIQVQPAPHRLSWFHRSLIFGGGVAVIAVIFLSAVFTAISDPSTQATEGGQDDSGYLSGTTIDDRLVPTEEEPATSDIFTSASSAFMFGELRALRPVARSRRIRPRVHRAAYRPRRRTPAPKSIVADFVPTTLIIFPENGEIKTRIEPNLTAAYKRPTTFTN